MVGKTFPRGANSFLLGGTHFRNGICVSESQQLFINVVSLVQNGRQTTKRILFALSVG